MTSSKISVLPKFKMKSILIILLILIIPGITTSQISNDAESYFSLDSLMTVEEYIKTSRNDSLFEKNYFYKQIMTFEDSTSQMSFDEILSLQDSFKKNNSYNQLNTNSANWGHVKLRGKKNIDTTYIFQFTTVHSTRWNKVEAWTVHEDNSIEYSTTGKNVEAEDSAFPAPVDLLKIRVKANEKVDIFLRFDKVEVKPNSRYDIAFYVINKEIFPGYFKGYPFKGIFCYDADIEPFHGNIIRTHKIFTEQLKSYTIDEIHSKWVTLDKTLVTETKSEPNKTYWTKLHIMGSPYLIGEQLFQVGSYEGDDSDSFDHLDYYVYRNSSKSYEVYKTGDHVSVNNKPYKFWASFIKIDIQENDTLDVFIRMEGKDPRIPYCEMNLFHIDKTTIFPKQVYFGLKNGVFFGILALQFLFFLILYIIEKAPIHLYFCLIVLGTFLSLSTDETNYYSFVLFPAFRDLHTPIHYLGLFLGPLGYVKFAEYYFNYKKPNIFSTWLIPIFIIALACFTLLAVKTNALFNFNNIHEIVMLLQFIAIIISLTLAYKAPFQKNVSKKMFLAAFFPIAITGILFFSNNFSTTISTNFPWAYEYFYDLFRIGIIMMLILLSLSIGHRTNRLKAEKEIAEKLAEKNEIILIKSKQNEVLLKEIHHRVKNNLQTISSLLYLQSYNLEDEQAKEKIVVSQQRVESMALIHKNLYQRDNLASIEMRDYISKLSQSLDSSYGRENIKLQLDINELELDVDTATPLGLVINEIVTNSYKYAFPNNSEGIISISMKKDMDEKITLIISDNGIGKKADVKDSFGTKLVSLLIKQIGAQLETDNVDGYWNKIVVYEKQNSEF